MKSKQKLQELTVLPFKYLNNSSFDVRH